jgi:DNA-binding beta-propeller fold protein YncE
MTHRLIAALALCAAALSAQSLHLQLLGSYKTKIFAESAAEIPAYDAATRRIFVVNASQKRVDVLSAANPASPSLSFSVIPPASCGFNPNSVAVKNGIVAIAMEASPKTDPGFVYFTDVNGMNAKCVTAGALPDMLIFTPDGKKVLVANEGEPNDAYSIDPEGSVSIVDVSGGLASIDQTKVTTASFAAFNAPTVIDSKIRIYGPGASVAQDLEPEYIAVSADSKTAWVVLQENNAMAVLNIDTATITKLVALGFKDHSLAANAFDPTDTGAAITIGNWPVLGMYQPDGIAAFEHGGQTYIVSANEGDARAYSGFNEERRVSSGSYVLDPVIFPNAATLKMNGNMGRLTVTDKTGDDNGDGKFDRILVFGARSFSVWDSNVALVYDSGDQLERLTAKLYPSNFNANHEENAIDNRSDNKGPEPEGVTIASIGGVPHAFIGLERIGGVMVYSLANPAAPQFVLYNNNRNFALAPEASTEDGTGADLGLEASVFVPAADSPTGKPLLITANEVSGSTSIFEVRNLASLAGKVSASIGGAVFNRLTNTWFVTVTLRNTTASAIKGAFYGAFDNLPAKVELVKKAGLLPTGTYTELAPQANLAPGASAQYRVEFKNPDNVRIAFAPSFYIVNGN